MQELVFIVSYSHCNPLLVLTSQLLTMKSVQSAWLFPNYRGNQTVFLKQCFFQIQEQFSKLQTPLVPPDLKILMTVSILQHGFRNLIEHLFCSGSWTIAESNKAADFLARRGNSVLHLNNQKLAYYSVKEIIKKCLMCFFSQDVATRNGHKFWYKHIHDIPEQPGDKSAAMLWLFSGHACLLKHLHRIKLAPDFLCLICDNQETMDMLHIASCPTLPPVSFWQHYWIARLKLKD